MNIDVSANPVRKINPAVRVLRADRATVKKYAVHSTSTYASPLKRLGNCATRRTVGSDFY